MYVVPHRNAKRLTSYKPIRESSSPSEKPSKYKKTRTKYKRLITVCPKSVKLKTKNSFIELREKEFDIIPCLEPI